MMLNLGLYKKKFKVLRSCFKVFIIFALARLPNGVIGNTTDSGSVKSRFEPWLGNFFKYQSLYG